MTYDKQVSVKLIFYLSMMPLLLSINLARAQEDPKESSRNNKLNSRWHVEASLLLGVGFDEHEVGRTTDNHPITISAGGGVGGGLIFGYGFSPRWDINLGFGMQSSSLQPEVENAKGNFLRTFVLANLKYRIPVSTSGLINIGGGISYYFPGDLDVNISAVSGGAHISYGYDKTAGFQILGEYEGFFYKEINWIVGLKYTHVVYEINSAMSNGILIPVAELNKEISNEIGKLEGSSIDLILSLIYYF